MSKQYPSVSVIISTYNNKEWLEKTLWGYKNQTFKDFEIVIADDGSQDDTREMLVQYRELFFHNLKHVWHPDNGFEKTKILNKAILASSGDYLIFVDQDCVPRYDFVETHLKHAEEGYFLSGGHFLLPISISKGIQETAISSGKAFQLKWLKAQGLKLNFKSTKLIQIPFFSSFMNKITPAKASWNGGNSSAWRKDVLAVNGFNEEMKYGGEDREFGERLANMKIKSKQLRYSAICIHLDHARPYRDEEIMKLNKSIREATKKNKVIRTPYGIEKL